MRLKSYFSATVEAAMEQARRELGDEALLVNARPAAPEARYLGSYEVVFGVLPHEVSTTPEPSKPSIDTAAERLREDLVEIRRQIERLALSFPSTPEADKDLLPPVSGSTASSELAAFLNEELSQEIAAAVCSGASLEQFFSTNAQLGKHSSLESTVAFVGPPGAGKTTTLIKLAVRYGLAQRRPVRIISVDHHRVAAADQLRALSALLGIPCEVAETSAELKHQLLEHRNPNTLTLIDTPGIGFREISESSDLAALFSEIGTVDAHLVLSASTKYEDLRRMVASYRCFAPSKLLFTRIDETCHFGALVNASAETGLPISFLSHGQLIPDDLEEATPRRIAELVLGERAASRAQLRRMGAAA